MVDDLEHWNLHDDFTGFEAASLASGYDPARAYVGHNPTLSAYEKVSEAMERAFSRALFGLDEAHLWPADARAFWENSWESPKLLRSNAMLAIAKDIERRGAAPESPLDFAIDRNFQTAVFSREELARWFAARANLFTPKYRFDLTPSKSSALDGEKDKPLTTTERNTLLGIIAAMAVKKYRFDPRPGSRLEMLGRLRADCDAVGVPISDDTLRSKLREALRLLPAAKSAPE